MNNWQKITTYGHLKDFLNALSDEQLLQPIRIAQEDTATITGYGVDILECDYINPSGDGAEPIDMFLPGGECYDPEFNPLEETVVGNKGDVYIYAERPDTRKKPEVVPVNPESEFPD